MSEKITNRIAAARAVCNWSQADLAARTGLSRPEISAIETGRVTPAVTAALALARALETPIETLFGSARDPAGMAPPAWAIDPPPRSAAAPLRYWSAQVGDRTWLYPAEATAQGILPHDGVLLCARGGPTVPLARQRSFAADTLVLATCDPAASLLAQAVREQTAGRLRLIALVRSSAAALELLAQGKVHAAGVHMASAARPQDNAAYVAARLPARSVQLIHIADWQTGVVLRETGRFRSAAAAARAHLRWVGREPGTGVRRCLDRLLGADHRYTRLAPDHTGVVTAVQSGWADAGVCPQLPVADRRMAFLPVEEEAYALCFATDPHADPRLATLLNVLRSATYRQWLAALPGCRAQRTGRRIG